MEEQVFFGKYVLKEEIARGGMGILYRALDRTLNRQVAIKALHPHLSGDSAFVMRFLREARAMARLDHENIVRIYAVEEQQGTHCLAMEYFPGKNLRQLLDTPQWRPTSRRTLDIMIQITSALAFAHASGIVHRDIKPANILVNAQGKAKLTDFGIAAAADEMSLTSAGQILGTPEYMAPEQARGEGMDPRTDLYALGMVMYELLVGGTPYRHVPKTAILTDLVRPSGELNLEFPLAIPSMARAIVEDLVRRNPQERTPDANTLLTQLRYVYNSAAQSEEGDDGYARLFAADSRDGTLQMAPPARTVSGPTTPMPSQRRVEPSVTMAATDILSPGRTPTPPNLYVPFPSPAHAAPSAPPPSFAERMKRYHLLPVALLGAALVVVLAGVVLYLTVWQEPEFDLSARTTIGGATGGGQSGQGGSGGGGQGGPQGASSLIMATDEEEAEKAERARLEREGWLADQRARLDEERQRLAREREERDQEQARLKAERERLERDRRLATERTAALDAERKRMLEEQSRRVREQQQLEAEQERLRRQQEVAKEQSEKDRLAERQAEIVTRLNKQEAAQQRLTEDLKARLAAEQTEKERLAREQTERERQTRELEQRLAAERAERERLAQQQIEQERLAEELRQNVAAEQAERERFVREQAERDRQARDLQARVVTEQAEKERQGRVQGKAAAQSGAASGQAPGARSGEAAGQLFASVPSTNPSRVAASPTTQRRQLEGLLATFKTAYENKDLPAVQRLAQLDARGSKFFQMMFANYSTIQVDIDVSSISEQEATAEVKVTRLIDTKGQDVKPSPILRSKKVQVRRQGEGWGKVIW